MNIRVIEPITARPHVTLYDSILIRLAATPEQALSSFTSGVDNTRRNI